MLYLFIELILYYQMCNSPLEGGGAGADHIADSIKYFMLAISQCIFITNLKYISNRTPFRRRAIERSLYFIEGTVWTNFTYLSSLGFLKQGYFLNSVIRPHIPRPLWLNYTDDSSSPQSNSESMVSGLDLLKLVFFPTQKEKNGRGVADLMVYLGQHRV